MDDRTVDAILGKLTADTASQWQVVGEVLHELEKLSGVAPSGDTWQEAVSERLQAIGHPVSQGHLYKVRRSYNFMVGSLRSLGLSKELLSAAKISAVEVAERLSRLDQDEGHDALRACVDAESPATSSEIRRRYDDFLERHPDRRNLKQIAWVGRRNRTDDPDEVRPSDGMASDREMVGSGPVSNALAEPLSGADSWLAVLQPVISKLHDMEVSLRDREHIIKQLEEENSELRREIREARQHEQLASEALRDARKELEYAQYSQHR